MNISTGEGTTLGWNERLQSIPTREAQAAIENFYRGIRRPFSRPQHWDDPIIVPWQSDNTTVVRDVRVADAAPRKHNTCRVVDTLGRNGKRILPQRTRDEDVDVQELLEFLVRRFLRENSSSTEDHETDLPQDDSIQSRAYRDTWSRAENAGVRRLRVADASDADPNARLNRYYRDRRGQPMSGDSKPPTVPSSDHLRTATERARAMDSLGLDFHERLQAQAIETAGYLHFPEWCK